MTDEEITERRRHVNRTQTVFGMEWRQTFCYTSGEYADLLAEVERLRAREAALREIVERLARSEGRYASDDGDCCLYCAASTGPVFTGLEDTTLYHGEVCIVTKARALLGLETE